MGILSKLNVILPSILFEFYFLSGPITYYTRSASPESFFWLVILIKIGIGYLVYRLYRLNNRNLVFSGPALAALLVIAAYVVYFLSPDTTSPVVGGYNTIFLAVNLLFLIGYWRYPDVIQTRLEQLNSSNKVNRLYRILISLFFAWAPIGVLIGEESGLVQSGVVLLWIGFHMITEGITRPRDISETNRQVT